MLLTRIQELAFKKLTRTIIQVFLMIRVFLFSFFKDFQGLFVNFHGFQGLENDF